MKTLKESTSNNFSDISHSDMFLNMPSQARELKAKIKTIGTTSKLTALA